MVLISLKQHPRKNPLFSTQERLALVDEATKHIPHVRVETFDDLLVNFVKRKNAKFVIRGLRAVSDFEYEFQLASANRRLDNNVETIFLTPLESNYFISSSLVREISYYEGDISSFVPAHIEAALKAKWSDVKPDTDLKS